MPQHKTCRHEFRNEKKSVSTGEVSRAKMHEPVFRISKLDPYGGGGDGESEEACSAEVLDADHSGSNELVDEKKEIIDNLKSQKSVVSMNFTFADGIAETVVNGMLHE